MRSDEELLAIARRVDPVPSDAFSDLARSPEGIAMLAEITVTASRRRASRRVVAVAAVAAVLVGVVTATRPEPRRPEARWSPALVVLAEESPRLLIHADGWRVTSAEELGGGHGEMFFENGRRCQLAGASEGCYWMSLAWYPVESYRRYLADRERGADASWDIEIDGHDAVLLRHDAPAPDVTEGIVGDPFTGTTFYALWADGGHWLELRSDVVPTVDEFRDVAATLHRVDVGEWLGALPDSVVQSHERPSEIDRILVDVPVPPHLDLEELASRPGVRGAIEYEVMTAVVCGWIDHWIEGNRSGDARVTSEAADALAGARRWRVFRDGGQFEEVVFEIADAMARGEPVDVGWDESVPAGVGYRRHLGCEGS
ncbi:MAG TPA: hypothetical protein VHN37_00225 [Actinomycetota bacterium]|nr:hypothetical protein [Actinomycetota bacterium]